MVDCSRLEKQVNRWTVPVLFRCARHPQTIFLHKKMMIWTSDIDLPVLEALSVRWIGSWERASAVEDVCHQTRSVRPNVDHQKDRSGQFRRKRGRKFLRRFHAAGRCADHNEITSHQRNVRANGCAWFYMLGSGRSLSESD